MQKFKIGDRVKAVSPDQQMMDRGLLLGDTGVIEAQSPNRLMALVSFDKSQSKLTGVNRFLLESACLKLIDYPEGGEDELSTIAFDIETRGLQSIKTISMIHIPFNEARVGDYVMVSEDHDLYSEKENMIEITGLGHKHVIGTYEDSSNIPFFLVERDIAIVRIIESRTIMYREAYGPNGHQTIGYKPECVHEAALYEGLIERYNYCVKCNVKLGE